MSEEKSWAEKAASLVLVVLAALLDPLVNLKETFTLRRPELTLPATTQIEDDLERLFDFGHGMVQLMEESPATTAPSTTETVMAQVAVLVVPPEEILFVLVKDMVYKFHQ